MQMVDAGGNTVSKLSLHEGSGGTLKIDDINTGVSPDLKLIYDTGAPAMPSQITLAGKVDAVKNNQVDLQDLAAKLELSLKDVDLSAAQPLLTMAGQPHLAIHGMAAGTIAGDLQPGQAGSIGGELSVNDLSVQTPQLADVYHAPTVRVPVKISRGLSSGVSRLQADLSVIAPEATIKIDGDLPESALDALKAKKIPAQPGTIALS
ncbi:MAG: hypothetical protein ACTHLN_03615, partial [Tepidisphaeraceae bacterium]